MPRQSERTVYVIMGNDFPEAVFDSQQKADDFVMAAEKADKAARAAMLFGSGPRQRIHWRAHAFKVQ